MKKALLMTKLLPNPTETEKNTSCDILVITIFFTVRFPVHSTNSISKEKKIKNIRFPKCVKIHYKKPVKKIRSSNFMQILKKV